MIKEVLKFMAGRQGFEPWEVLPSTVFKTAAFDHSAISRNSSKCGGATRIRTGDQSFAGSCLSHLAMAPHWWCPEPDLNRHSCNSRGILSPLCLPIPPSGLQNFKNLDNFCYKIIKTINLWSGRRDSNPRPQPWQGCALPLSYSRISIIGVQLYLIFIKNQYLFYKKIKFFAFFLKKLSNIELTSVSITPM